MKKTIKSVATTSIQRTADEVWQVLRRFEDLQWALGMGVDGVEVEGEGVGMVRKVSVPDDSEPIVEQLTESDDVRMTISYAIVEGGMPGLNDYMATARVLPIGDECRIQWECQATTDDEPSSDPQVLIDGIAEGLVTVFAAQFS